MGAKKRRRWRRLLVILGVMLSLAVGGVYLLVLALLPSAVVYAPNAKETIDPAQDLDKDQLRALGVTRALRVEVRSPPASLSCWIVDPPQGPPRSTVLALHGIRDSRRSLLDFGKELARRGHRAVLPDLRGHGRSGGRWLTYGVVESADLVVVLDRLAAEGLLVEPVRAVGFSYGGAVGLQLAARDRRVKAVATVAIFTSLREVVPLYLRRNVPVIGHLVTEGQLDDAVARAGRLASFDPTRASPLRAIAETKARVLLVHGAEDRHIPADHARELHRAADPGQARLLIIPGADHVTIDGASAHEARGARLDGPMNIHLVDGTYELFRQFFGAPEATAPDGREVGATRGLLRTLLALLRDPETTHVAVAFDHVIESFRNELFDGYKRGEGIDPALWAQFPLAERATRALGVCCWPMVEFEADDALATAAARWADARGVEQVRICSPDKDLAQCVRGRRVVLLDRRRKLILDETGVKEKYGVPPASIPDWLALVGDDADGIPGIPRWGKKSAATVLARYLTIDAIPEDARAWEVKVRGAAVLSESLRERREEAQLYRRLTTLRLDVPRPETLDDIRWRGARRSDLEQLCQELGEEQVPGRVSLWRGE